MASPEERSGSSGGELLLSLGLGGGLILVREGRRLRRLRVLEQCIAVGESHGEIEVNIFVTVGITFSQTTTKINNNWITPHVFKLQKPIVNSIISQPNNH